MSWTPSATARTASPAHGAMSSSQRWGAGLMPLSDRGAELAQTAEGVDARLVAVAPVDLDPVAPDRCDAPRVHVRGHAGGVEAPLAAPLIDAARAAAGEPEIPHREHALAAVAPGDRALGRALLADRRPREARLVGVGHARRM